MFTDNKIKLVEAAEKEPFCDIVYKKALSKNEYAIIYIKQGKGKFLFDKKASTLHSGSFIVLYGADMLTCAFSKKYPAKIISIFFESDDAFLKRGIYKCFNAPSAEKAMEELIDEFIVKGNFCEQVLSTKLENTLYTLFSSVKKKSDVDAVIESLARDIHKSILTKIDVNKYAQKVNLSKDRLSVIFRNRFGLPPYKYQIMLKINMAKELLLCTDLSIGEISQKLGFSNQLYFSSAYKKYVGVTPSDMRKQGTQKSSDSSQL